jgi:hypothetical protein
MKPDFSISLDGKKSIMMRRILAAIDDDFENTPAMQSVVRNTHQIIARELMEEEAESIPELFEQYVRAVHFGILNKRLDEDKIIVEKSVTHHEFVPELMRMFPESKFIHIVRNPYSNLVALRQHRANKRNRYPVLLHKTLAIQDSLFAAYRNALCGRVPQSKYRMITYEHLLSDTFNVMEGTARFIGVEFQDCLLEPTILGIPWKGNSSRGIEFSGVDEENINRWVDEIKPLEVRYINRAVGTVLSAFGYQGIRKSGRTWPSRKEGLKKFFLNRTGIHLIRRGFE